MNEQSTQTPDLIYTMSDAMRETGLGRTTIKTLSDLHLISLADGMGAGVKRLSEPDLLLLKDAAELLKVRHTPEQVVLILQNREKYLHLIQETIQFMLLLNENPEDDELWQKYTAAILNMSLLDDEEKSVMQSLLYRHGISGKEASRVANRAYQNIGYAFLALMRLKTISATSSPRDSD